MKPLLIKITPAAKKLVTKLQSKGLPKVKFRSKPREPKVSVMTPEENNEIDAWLSKITKKAERSVALAATRTTSGGAKTKTASSARKPLKKKKASR
jgi:hypothetical protein